MDETVSFWKKQPDELNVGESITYVAIMPVVAIAAIMTPLYVIGSLMERRQARKAKKKAHLTVVPTEEAK
jgi:hypothetical protein